MFNPEERKIIKATFSTEAGSKLVEIFTNRLVNTETFISSSARDNDFLQGQLAMLRQLIKITKKGEEV